ncbi:MAG: sigma 54-interacting transcriptional regulator, partial [Anaerovoracaceae bacterium]
ATIIHENIEGRKLLSTGTPITDKQGKISKVITTSRDITELSTIQKRLETGRGNPASHKDFEQFFDQGIVSGSPAMFHVLQLAKKLSSVDSTVLITGESGVGKGVIAKFLHTSGDRKNAPFITVNCGAIPENLIESELFGYEKGAFTGARADGKKGYFEAAENGTLFLDEISELPLNLQVKLLQVIQDRLIRKVGGTASIPVNARIISATNKDLHQLVKEQKFREDLYYRLNVVPINVPPLRERTEDIAPLLHKFLKKYNESYHQNKKLDPQSLSILLKFKWPGNIRELQNIVERLILTCPDPLITVENLPVFLLESTGAELNALDKVGSLGQAMDLAEKKILLHALKTHKSTRAMARALKVSQPTIVRKLHKYGISSHEE